MQYQFVYRINSPHNQAVTTHLLKELSVGFADADPEIIKGNILLVMEFIQFLFC